MHYYVLDKVGEQKTSKETMKELKTIETELHAEEFVLVFTATAPVRRHPANDSMRCVHLACV